MMNDFFRPQVKVASLEIENAEESKNSEETKHKENNLEE
jgi:hypothetical protein